MRKESTEAEPDEKQGVPASAAARTEAARCSAAVPAGCQDFCGQETLKTMTLNNSWEGGRSGIELKFTSWDP